MKEKEKAFLRGELSTDEQPPKKKQKGKQR